MLTPSTPQALVLQPGWQKLSVSAAHWPEHIKVRSIRGLATLRGSIYVGLRTDHGSAGQRYGHVLAYKYGRWTLDTPTWPDSRIDRVNHLRKHGSAIYASLGGQYKDLAGAYVGIRTETGWTSLQAPRAFSAVMATAHFDERLVAALVAPTVRGPAVAIYDDEWTVLNAEQFEHCKFSFVFTLAVYKGEIYMGAVDSGNHCMSGVWKWSGKEWVNASGWEHAAKNVSITGVNKLLVHDGKLLATVSSGKEQTIYPVWSFDGKSWSHPDAPMPDVWRKNIYYDFVSIYCGDVFVGGGGNGMGTGPDLWQLTDGRWKDVAGPWRTPNDDRYIYEMISTKDGFVIVFGGSRPGGGDVWLMKREPCAKSPNSDDINAEHNEEEKQRARSGDAQ